MSEYADLFMNYGIDYRKLYADLQERQKTYFLTPGWENEYFGPAPADHIYWHVNRTDWNVEHRYLIKVVFPNGGCSWGIIKSARKVKKLGPAPASVEIVMEAIEDPADYETAEEFEERMKYTSVVELTCFIHYGRFYPFYVEHKRL